MYTPLNKDYTPDTDSETGYFWVKPVEKPSKKPAANLIQFQFVMPVIIKGFFMFTVSNDQ